MSSPPHVPPVDRRSVSPPEVTTEDDLLTKMNAVAISAAETDANESPSPAGHTRVSAPTAKDKGKNADKASILVSPLDPRSSVFKPNIPLGANHQDGIVIQPAVQDNQNTALDHHHSTNTNTTPPISLHSSPFTPSSSLAWGGVASPPTSYTPSPSTQRSDGDMFGPGSKPGAARPRPNHNRAVESIDVGRFLMVTNVPLTAEGDQAIAPFKAIIVKHLKTKGWFIVSFYDSRDAMSVHDKLSSSSVRFSQHSTPVTLDVVAVSPEVVRQITGNGQEFDSFWKDSESILNVKVDSSIRIGARVMREYLAHWGEIKNFDLVSGHTEAYVVEYFDTRIAHEVAELINSQPWDRDGGMRAQFVSEDPFQGDDRHVQAASAPYTLGSAVYRGPENLTLNHNSNPSLSSSSSYDHLNLLSGSSNSSPALRRPQTAPSRFVDSREGTGGGIPNGHMAMQDWSYPGGSQYFANHDGPSHLSALGSRMNEPAALQSLLNQMDMHARARQRSAFNPPSLLPAWGNRSEHANNRQAIPPENKVDPERILAGKDPRTSIMVKDVPNKLSRQQLINILREVVPGEFDFVYLRFDFHNHCNVGYAFVNFTSVRALYTFYRAKAGRKWNMFSSEKVLQVSYANIQGKAALVDRFRNSGVMDVTEEWRPQIFYSSGAHKGEPEPFPEPDHPSTRNQRTSARLGFLAGAASYDPNSSSSGSGSGEYGHPGPSHGGF